jgi:hypothetical protein
MWIKQVRLKKILLGFGFIFVFIAGIFTFDDIPVIANILHPSVEPEFQVNQNGEAYGSLANVNTPGKEPDLVLAKGEDGTEGYLRLKDMWGEQPNNPEEAIAYMKKQEEEKASGHKYIPLYASDGETVIGKFKVW